MPPAPRSRDIRIQYFPETDTLSIRLNDTPSIESEEIAPDVVVDFG
ncbi:MAG: DUF2283 domain-containing protein [Leptolyngbyaceae cyanobacterium]